MDWILIAAGILLLILGFFGSILPVIPGPPTAFLGLLMLHFTSGHSFQINFLVLWGIIAALVTILDYIVPVYGTKKMGGTRRGIIGSTIGLLAGIFVLPFLGIVIGPFGLTGIILGPFIGAYIGEMTVHNDSQKAFKAALGSFIGFITGTIMKFVFAGFMIFYFVRELL